MILIYPHYIHCKCFHKNPFPIFVLKLKFHLTAMQASISLLAMFLDVINKIQSGDGLEWTSRIGFIFTLLISFCLVSCPGIAHLCINMYVPICVHFLDPVTATSPVVTCRFIWNNFVFECHFSQVGGKAKSPLPWESISYISISIIRPSHYVAVGSDTLAQTQIGSDRTDVSWTLLSFEMLAWGWEGWKRE